MDKKITVRIPARTVEVDVEDWCREYGNIPTAASIRESVKSYFDLANHIPGHLDGIVRVVR